MTVGAARVPPFRRVPAVETDTVVPTAVGDLGAILRVPRGGGARVGVVLVDGSGDGDRHDWGGWPQWLTDVGASVLRHDKPGCGGSPGHWTDQTIEDRAHETIAAVRVLRADPATVGRPVGLYGISQGGWVALLAAALEPGLIDFVVCHSGPGTTPAEQERARLEAWVRAEGHDDATVAEAMAWVDARADLIRSGTPVEDVLAAQSAYAGRRWYPTVSTPYDSPAVLRFVRGVLDFDPVAVLPRVGCPVLVLFGAADDVVPVRASLAAFAQALPEHPRHGFAVFPSADHGLFVADPADGVARRDQLAPAYLATVAGFLAGLVADR